MVVYSHSSSNQDGNLDWVGGGGGVLLVVLFNDGIGLVFFVHAANIAGGRTLG